MTKDEKSALSKEGRKDGVHPLARDDFGKISGWSIDRCCLQASAETTYSWRNQLVHGKTKIGGNASDSEMLPVESTAGTGSEALMVTCEQS